MSKFNHLKFSDRSTSRVILLLAVSALLLYPAFYNGYPYVFSDTGTYIRSGFIKDVPADRPIFYGLFIFISSLSSSLWLTVAAQSIIMVGIMMWLQRILISNYEPSVKQQHIVFVTTAFILLKCSSLPFLVSTILPDVFTAAPVMILLILLLKTQIKNWQSIVLMSCYVFITLTHFSNLICLTLLLPMIAGLKYVYKIPFISAKRFYTVSTITLSMWLIAPAVNSALGYGFKMTKASHVFTMATFIDNGLLHDYLNHTESAKQYSLYQFKDSLPANSGEFLWNFNNSPLYKTGGWDHSAKEYKSIINEIIFSKKYFFRWAKICLTHTFQQLTRNEIGLDLIYSYKNLDSAPSISMKDYFPEELHQYLQSRQNNNALEYHFDEKTTTQNTLITVCLLITIVLLIKLGFNNTTIFASCIAILYVIFNAATAATFAAVVDRYNSRISWIIIFFTINTLGVYLPYVKRYFNKLNNKIC